MPTNIETNQNQTMKLIFSNIKCKIVLNDISPFALVIRIGKTSSKYTSKKQLKTNHLQFSQLLQIPIDYRLLNNQNSKKQKCQIMLYKFKINRDKETKQLVGMASINMDTEMFEQQQKKIRLTNSFDKQAYVVCNIKVQFGQADILQNYDSKISSFYVKSQSPSFTDMQQLKFQLPITNTLHRSQIKNLQRNSPHSHPQNNFIQLINDIQNQQGQEFRAGSQKMQRNTRYINNNSMNKNNYGIIRPIAINNRREESDRQYGRKIDTDLEVQEKNSLLEICNKLKNQNEVLMSKLENLENHVYEKEKAQQEVLQYSLVKSNVSSSQAPKRSAMIKKNLKMKIQIPTIKIHSKQSVSTDLAQNQAKLKQKNTQKPEQQNQHSKIMNSSQCRPLQMGIMQSIKQSDGQYSPLNPRRSNNFVQLSNSSQINLQNSQNFSQLGYTFAGEKQNQSRTIHNLNIKSSIVQYKYQPENKPFLINQYGQQPWQQIGNNFGQAPNAFSSQQSYYQSNQSLINRSVSGLEKTHLRSYSRFNSKGKYKIVGSIRPQQSQEHSLSFVKPQLLRQITKDHQLSHLKQKTSSQIEIRVNQSGCQNNFKSTQSDELFNQNQQNQIDIPYFTNLANMTAQVSNKQNRLLKKNTNDRRTLQQLDNDTEQKYRKNQRNLKRTITQLTKAREAADSANKIISAELEKKKQLTYQEFQRLKNQIFHLRQYVSEYQIKIQSNNRRIQQLSKRCGDLESQNCDLKKKNTQISSKAIEYKKIIQMNDYQLSNDIKKQDNRSMKVQKKLTIVNSSNSDIPQNVAHEALNTSANKSLKRLTSLKNLTRTQPMVTDQPLPPNTSRNTSDKKIFQQSQKMFSQFDVSKLDNSQQVIPSNLQIKSKGVQLLKSNTRPYVPKPHNVNGQNQSLTNSSHLSINQSSIHQGSMQHGSGFFGHLNQNVKMKQTQQQILPQTNKNPILSFLLKM